MYDTRIPSTCTKFGNSYEIPQNINEETFYDLIYEFLDFAKVKGLTVREAQLLFKACEDCVLENKLV